MKNSVKRVVSMVAASIGAFALVALGSTASVAQAPDVFTVTSLSTTGAVAVDASALAGDDDGLVGVTGTKYLFGGDNATVGFDLADLGNPYVTNIDNVNNQNNWLFSDLKTQTSYLFVADQPNPALDQYDITGIQPLDQNGDISGSVIPLSVVVSFDNETDVCVMFASGYGRVAIWDGCAGVVYDIALPSGEVTTISGVAKLSDYATSFPVMTDWYETANGVFQGGVVEYDGSQLHILALAYNNPDEDLRAGVYRYNIQTPTDLPTEVLGFLDIDLWKFTVSPATNQWCSGAEGGWDAISDTITDELAFCADAVFSTTAAPALANTGVDSSGYLVAGAAVLVAGAAMVLVARRRTARG